MAKKKTIKAVLMPKGPDDSKWRAESDARTLSDAEAIRSDTKRLEGARKCLEHSVSALHRTTAGPKMMKRGGRKSRFGAGRY